MMTRLPASLVPFHADSAEPAAPPDRRRADGAASLRPRRALRPRGRVVRRGARVALHALLLAALLGTGGRDVAAQGPPPPLQPLGPPPVPAGNPITPAKADLGKALFWDEQLSSSRTVACGTCHQAPNGGSDPRSVVGAPPATHPGADGQFGTPDDVTGSPGVILRTAAHALEWETSFGLRPQVTGRKSPSFVDAGYSPTLFWDGRAGGTFNDPLTGSVVLAAGAALESQAAGPPVSSAEMGHAGRDWADVAARIAAVQPLELSPSVPDPLRTWIDGRRYDELFDEAFGTPEVTPSRIAMAIATYERTLFSNQTPFDDDLRGIAGSLTPQEVRGRNVFVQRNCGTCHAGSLMSDNLFHYIGVRPAGEDLGRFGVTAAPGDRGAFRTPALRNVALRAPYMHNGRFATLEEVVDFYDRGGDFTAPNKAPQIVPLNLTPGERADLLAFLRRPLTDPRVEAGVAPFDRPALFAESDRVPQRVGAGVPGSGGQVPVVIALEPPVTGNPTFTVGIDRGLGGATAILVVDEADPGTGPDVPATASFARREIALGRTGAGAGYGSVTLAIPDDPALVGRTVWGRWFVFDGGAPGGVAASAAFRMTFFGTAEGGIGVSGFMVY